MLAIAMHCIDNFFIRQSQVMKNCLCTLLCVDSLRELDCYWWWVIWLVCSIEAFHNSSAAQTVSRKKIRRLDDTKTVASQTANCFWLEHQHPNNVSFVFLCTLFLFWVLFPFLVVGPSPIHGRFPSFDLFLTCPPIIHPWQANSTDDIAAVKTILNERCIFQEKFTFQLHGIQRKTFGYLSPAQCWQISFPLVVLLLKFCKRAPQRFC